MRELLAREMREHPLRWVMAGLCLLMFIPGLDLAVSRSFYTQDAGFYLAQAPIFAFVREYAPNIIIATLIFCLVLWLAGLAFRKPFLGITTPRVFYLLATLAIGPGLIVETILKSYWGRARPNDTVFFGGEAAFTPPGWIAQECSHNCAFVSGHAAIGFWVTAYAFLLPKEWRMTGVIAGLLFGALIGFVRVIQGAHFLSDIVFAGAFVLMVNAGLAQLILRRAEKQPA